MQFTGAEIGSFLGSFMWPFFRIAAMVAAMPVFSSAFVSIRVRLIFALALTLVIMPVVPAVPAIDPISVAGVIIIAQQLLIGICMGFIFHLVFGIFIIAGQIIATQMGLAFATMVDPINGSQAPVLSIFFMMLITLLFLSMDGHLALISAVASSFTSLPIGTEGIGKDGFWTLALWGNEMFRGAVLVSLPAVTALLLVNVALGVMTRAAPQLNIFAVGFAVTISAGLYVLVLTLPSVLPQFELVSAQAFELIRTLIHAQQ